MPNHSAVNLRRLPFLDRWVKPLLIVANCLIGFVFEFLVELPFMVLVACDRMFGKRRSSRDRPISPDAAPARRDAPERSCGIDR